MNIGLTGGIACGKSTVASLLVERGAVLIDADRIAREIVEPGSPALDRISERFGEAVLDQTGRLNRRRLADIVFNDLEARKALESITHPEIRSIMRRRMEEAEKVDPSRLVVVDVPLLYESRLETMFQGVMVVYVPVDIQRARLMERDHFTVEEADARIQAQLSIEHKKTMADYVIDNSGSIEQTRHQIDRFWQERGLSNRT
jgi:dephospho-CoA kinase